MVDVRKKKKKHKWRRWEGMQSKVRGRVLITESENMLKKTKQLLI